MRMYREIVRQMPAAPAPPAQAEATITSVGAQDADVVKTDTDGIDPPRAAVTLPDTGEFRPLPPTGDPEAALEARGDGSFTYAGLVVEVTERGARAVVRRKGPGDERATLLRPPLTIELGEGMGTLIIVPVEEAGPSETGPALAQPAEQTTAAAAAEEPSETGAL